MRNIDADWVSSGEEALQRLAENSYDLAVLDVKMPHIGGIELMRKMRARRPGMKFIFMTGHGSEQDFQAGASEAGVEYYLAKPVHIEDLMRKMAEVLGAGAPRP
ncbi:MAG: response regulator [Chromatiales bacterium]|nr:response regulator [Chromatiales bacterium]